MTLSRGCKAGASTSASQSGQARHWEGKTDCMGTLKSRLGLAHAAEITPLRRATVHCVPQMPRVASAPMPDRTVFTLGHSPDPDDAFMFYAMAANKIDLRGYQFEHRLEDIQTLNERA